MTQPKQTKALMREALRRYSINTKIAFIIIIVGGITWSILDYIQGRQLNELFNEQLNAVLLHNAQEARILFDRYTRSFDAANNIIKSQENFIHYISATAPYWSHENSTTVLRRYNGLPPWLPNSSVLRSMAKAQFYLLFDNSGNLREVYAHQPIKLPQELLNASTLLRRLSHNQTIMTELAGKPFMISSGEYRNAKQELQASLMLMSQLNNDFLYLSMEGLMTDKIVILINNTTKSVLASSHPELIREGSTLQAVKNDFLITGKSFFDYGASDLQIHFASVVPKNEYENLDRHIRVMGLKHRAAITLAMILPFLAALYWITHRLTGLTHEIVKFSKDHLSAKEKAPNIRDQLCLLEERFQQLADIIIQTNIETENKYRALIETTGTGFVIINSEGFVLDANQEYLRLTGRDNFDEIMAHNVMEWTAEYDRKKNEQEVKNCFNRGYLRNLEIDYKSKDGTLTPVEINATVVQQEGQNIILSILRDITERKEAEERLRISLREKEVLLKEIHHRVKNNMQIISSMLFLQSGKTENPEALAVIRDSRNRVRTMGLIHEKLYCKDDLARIDFADYIHTLTQYLSQSYAQPSRNIRFSINADNVFLSVDTAIPCGLILNEIITNSLKYAFKPGGIGLIEISLRHQRDGTMVLTVRDNGAGLPPDFDPEKTNTLGMTLINSLADQLNAILDLRNRDGVEWVVKFADHSP